MKAEEKIKAFLESNPGTIDVFVMMDSAKSIERFVDIDFNGRANKVYFTPSNSHNHPGRSQKVEGTFSPDRPAVIFDGCWWTGASFMEAIRYLHGLGYPLKKMYGYYVFGNGNPDKPQISMNTESVFDKASKVLMMFEDFK